MCALFHSRDEEYRVLLPFIKEGFERGEKAFHIVNPKLREDHLKRLKSAGIDVVVAEQSGHFELRNWIYRKNKNQIQKASFRSTVT